MRECILSVVSEAQDAVLLARKKKLIKNYSRKQIQFKEIIAIIIDAVNRLINITNELERSDPTNLKIYVKSDQKYF